MKTRATLLLLWVSLGLWTQAPDNFKYQAVLRDASGNVKANTATTIVLSMLAGSVSGSLVYAETHAVTTNEFGLVNLTVGNGTNKTGTLAAIDWSANSYFLNVKVDGTDFGTSQLMSVPYALYAKTAGNGFSGNYNDLTNKPAAATVTETGLMSATDKTKLDGIAAGAEVNVNADWTATTGDGLIINKPILFSGSFADLTSKPTTISGYGITDAFSGSYNNLTDKPTLFDGTWNSLTGKPTFSIVATSGITSSNMIAISNGNNISISTAGAVSGEVLKYNGLVWSAEPDVYFSYTAGTGLSLTGTSFSLSSPVAVSTGGTGAASLTGILIGNGTNAFTGVTHSAANQYLRRNSANTAYEFGALAPVAGSGNYNDLTNKPTILNNTLYTTATGDQALSSNTTGYNNTANGSKALGANTTGTENTAIGANALNYNTTGNSNTEYGDAALYHNVANHRSTAIGYFAMFRADSRTTGRETFNTAVGYEALRGSSITADNTGQWNTAVGDRALLVNSSGRSNTAVGVNALYSVTSGNYNTAIGDGVGSIVTTGSNLTLLGYDAEPSSATAIDQITLGNGFISSLRCNVQSISSLSDQRDKKNITELSLGLNFLMQLKPRQFNWDKREWYEGNYSDGSLMQSKPTAGFIAQELDEVQTQANAEWLNLVLKDNPEKLEATYGNLLPVMVKAIQEQQQQIEELKARLQKLELLLTAKTEHDER